MSHEILNLVRSNSLRGCKVCVKNKVSALKSKQGRGMKVLGSVKIKCFFCLFVLRSFRDIISVDTTNARCYRKSKCSLGSPVHFEHGAI